MSFLNLKKYLPLLLILLLAAVLRFYQLGSIPPSPDWDEAALGYNAYSILHTGRDEYGKLLPLILRSFDDYKPGLYAYLTIPSISLFGLNTFAVRLPSAILGILSVFAVYFLAKELFPQMPSKNNLSFNNFLSSSGLTRGSNSKSDSESVIHNAQFLIPLITALLLAISPWAIQFSRVAFEANAAMAFNLFAVLFFLKGLKKPWFLSLSAFFFASNLYMYQSEKLFVPLLIIILFAIYYKKLNLSFWRTPKSSRYRKNLPLITAAILFFFLCIPMAFYTITSKGILSRATGVAITSQNTPMLKESTKRFIRDQQNHDTLGEILDSRRATQIKEIIGGYLSHYDFNWLFITGDQPRHHAPGMGLLYLWELPFLLIGLYQLFFSREDKQSKLLIFTWFALAPVPAALTFDVPHAVRTLNFLPTFQIITALGLTTVIYRVNLSFQRTLESRRYKQFNINFFLIFAFCFLLFTFFNIVYYLNQYFSQLNYFTSKDWQYGYQQAVEEVSNIQNNYKQIIVSNQVPLDQSYIFFLFYQKYSPQQYQTEKDRSDTGQGAHNFSKYQFRAINWGQEQKTHDMLYIGSPLDFPANVTPLKTINYLDGTPAIEIVEG